MKRRQRRSESCGVEKSSVEKRDDLGVKHDSVANMVRVRAMDPRDG